MSRHSSMLLLDNPLDLREVATKGSILQLHEDCDDADDYTELEEIDKREQDFIGDPVKSFKKIEKNLVNVDDDGCVKKKIIEEGGGMPLHDGCTVSIAYSGFWEGATEPFDFRKLHKPLVLDLKDNGLLPGLQNAVKSMLVGELSIFLISYKLMYGELGIPPRIKPKADCVFYVKLVRSILTPEQEKLDLSEPNMFQRIHKEVKMLYSSGAILHKSKNFKGAVQLFRKAIHMLHKCRLADENEEKIQEKLLIKLYINLAIAYNNLQQPLKACMACNELQRLNSLWNNSKALFQNAKALRMIGVFNNAEKKLKRAMKLTPGKPELQSELELLKTTMESCNQKKLVAQKIVGVGLICDEFKREVDELIIKFKQNHNLCKLVLPEGLNTVEMDYIKEACIRENLFYSKIQTIHALDKAAEDISSKPIEEQDKQNDNENFEPKVIENKIVVDQNVDNDIQEMSEIDRLLFHDLV